MANWTLYHNPRCSKCREALEMLKSRGIEPKVIEYLNEKPTVEELKSLVAKLQDPASALVRVKEDDYQKSQFNLDSVDEIIRQLAANPKLLERPIVVKDNEAVIARPVEKLKTLLST